MLHFTFCYILHFWIALIKSFQTIYIMFGSAEVGNFLLFSIVYDNDIIMTSFLSHGFQICIFCGTLNRLSACNVSMLYVVLGKFYRQIEKTK